MLVRRFVALVIVALTVAALVLVKRPGYSGPGSDTPWDYVGMSAAVGSLWSLAALALGGLVTIAMYLPRNIARAFLVALAFLAALAAISVVWPAYWTPWEYVRLMVTGEMGGPFRHLRPVFVLGFAGLVTVAILGATVWLSYRVTSDRPG